MIGIIYSSSDGVSSAAAKGIVAEHGLEEREEGIFIGDRIAVRRVDSELIRSESADSFGYDLLYFLSRHSSAKGVSAFTVHSTGNWSGSAGLGGRPRELSTAAPIAMLAALQALGRINAHIEKGYEATHHGPLLKTPSFFMELGGNDETRSNQELIAELARAAYGSAVRVSENGADFSKVVIGIGGNHYPSKFSKLAFEKGYAFSHIMSRYSIMNEDGSDNLGVLQQAIVRTTDAPQAAVLEWKSVNLVVRNKILSKLNEIGLDYERI